MAKFLKVVKIILIVLAVLLGVGYVILYFVNPEQAKYILERISYYLNKPLPIVGISLLAVLCFVWEIVKYSRVGSKAIAKMKLEYESEKESLKKQYETKKTEYSAVIGFYEQEIDVIADSVVEALNVIPNKKVKAIADKMKGNLDVLKTQIREKLKEIIDSDAEVLMKSKEEIVDSVVDIIRKELVEKYGERKEEVNNISTEA